MIDPNTAMSAAGEGAKAVSKFEEILQKIFGPKWTRNQADADAYADERKLQTIRDNPDMEIVYANGQMNARLRTPEALAFRAEQRQLAESIKQEENLEKILENAQKELLSTDEVSDDPVDDDWLTRFFGIAKDVSSDDMQFIWSKILAGEIVKPGSFSLRTLETIRNISSYEARIFEKALPFIISSGAAHFIPTCLTTFEKFGLSYGHIIQLEECGLINSTGTASLPLKAPSACVNFPLLNTNTEVLAITNSNEKELSFNLAAYPMTHAAVELISILDFTSNHDFFVDFSEKIHSENYPSTVMTIYEIHEDENGNACFDTGKPIYTFCPITIQRSGLAK